MLSELGQPSLYYDEPAEARGIRDLKRLAESGFFAQNKNRLVMPAIAVPVQAK